MVSVEQAENFQRFPNLPEAVSQSAGAAKGRATGQTPHEACFNVASGTAQTREARPRQFSCFGAVAPSLPTPTPTPTFNSNKKIFDTRTQIRYSIYDAIGLGLG